MTISRHIEEYLHENIPLSREMQVHVVAAEPEFVELSGPLAPNRNHYGSVFGGSASALAILAAWTLLHVRLTDVPGDIRLVIQKNTMLYQKAILEDFSAICRFDNARVWNDFVTTLRRKKKARIKVKSILQCQGQQVGEFEGHFVALDLSGS